MLLLTVANDAIPKAPDVIPSHTVAQWLLTQIRHILGWFGLENDHSAQEALYIILIALLSLAIGYLLRQGILWATRKVVGLRRGEIAKELLRERTFSKCFHVIPPLVFLALLPFAFTRFTHTLDVIERVAVVYTLCTFAIAVNAIMTFGFNRYNVRMNTRNLPLEGILNVGKGIVWIVVAIVSVSVLIDKSPMALLAGLGAFAAALMLIFKDSILGFVAGIQLSENDMLHKGDWIVVDGTQANGIVLDVSLTAVKIQNWDNTIITVPPHTLVSGSFQNWRGMSESGVRRIMQTFYVDWSTVVPCTQELIDSVLKKHPAMRPYIEAMQKGNGVSDKDTDAADATQRWLVNPGIRPVNGTLETNAGLFRAYLCMYLLENPFISSTSQILVRFMAPEVTALPLQIWCWSNTTNWNAYEGIQSAVIEHVTTVINDFGLEIYNVSTEDITITNPTPPAK